MENLVLGAAIGYKLDKVKPFVLSLRKYFDGKIIFLVDKLDDESRNFYASNKVETIIPREVIPPSLSYVLRFSYFLEVLKNQKEIDKVLITDVRDVIFQEDPFQRYVQNDLEFFAEPELIGNCQHNGPWISVLYGSEGFNQVKDKYVICVGTTAGKLNSMIEYLTKLINEFIRLSSIGRAHPTCDQGTHMYLIHTGAFKNFRINQNGEGMVSTMHHSKILRFNREGQLLNDDNTPTPVVHQYDRCGAFSVAFLKNCFFLSKKDGILKSAEYAVNNFNECDL